MMLQIGKHGVAFNRYQIFFFGAPARWKLCWWLARYWVPKEHRNKWQWSTVLKTPTINADESEDPGFFFDSELKP